MVCNRVVLSFKVYSLQGKGEIQSKFFYWASYLLLSSFLLGSFTCLVEGAPTNNPIKYAVVFDAGSTGTRAHAYTFNLKDGQLTIVDETSIPVKPGLSDYVEEPQKAGESIKNLLNQIKEKVPASFRSSTPIVLKGTAGLRRLNPTVSAKIIKEVQKVIDHSGFLVPKKAAAIMEGSDEAIFSWFTMNTLLGLFENVETNTTATIDIGGGSAQVTYALKDQSSVTSLKDFIRTIATPKGEMHLFAKSYPNLGMEAVRHTVFMKGNKIVGNHYVSECLNPSINSVKFKYGNMTYYLSGKTGGKTVVDFAACHKLLQKNVLPLVGPEPSGLNEIEIVAASYVIHRCIAAGIVDKDIGFGTATVGQFRMKAEEICASNNQDDPYLCLDFIYMSMLLSEGLKLNPEKKIDLYKRINGHYLSWSLGCAVQLVS